MRIPFALRQLDDRYVDATMVPSGLQCGCVCPGCGEPVLAKHKKTSNITSHFSHRAGSECSGALETSLHKAAKQALSEVGAVYLPHGDSGLKGILRFSGAKIEVPRGDFIPDVTAMEASGTEIGLEIFVTHAIDEEKLEKIKRAELTVIEIDLSKMPRFISYVDLATMFERGRYKARIVYNHAEVLKDRRKQKDEEVMRQKRERAIELERRKSWEGLMPWIRK